MIHHLCLSKETAHAFLSAPPANGSDSPPAYPHDHYSQSTGNTGAQLDADGNDSPYPSYETDWPSQAAEDAAASSSQGEAGASSAAAIAASFAASNPNGTYAHYDSDWPSADAEAAAAAAAAGQGG